MGQKRKKRGGSTGKGLVAGEERTRQIASMGGKVTAARRRKARVPYVGSVLDAMHAAGMVGTSWAAWVVFLSVVFGLALTTSQRKIFHQYTNREFLTSATWQMFNEAWAIVGRGGGKSRIAALIALFMAISFDMKTVAPGEPVVIPILAANTRQANIVFRYLRALCELNAFRPYIHRTLKSAIELHSGLTIEVMAAKYTTLRGFSLPCVVLDEIAFWEVDSEAAQSDEDIVDAIRPGLDRIDNSLLIGISSPYARKGMLHKVHEDYYGADDMHVLVWKADTRSMNPTFKAWRIAKRFKDDPVKAMAEYGRDGAVAFRSDVESFITAETLRQCTVPDRIEVPSIATEYRAFIDPAGGSGQDSMTVAIGHLENGNRAIIDALRERKPPFNVDDVTEEFAALMRSYGITSAVSDRYGGDWVRTAFANYGIVVDPSEKSKSDLYRECLPALNAGRVELLDSATLRTQFLNLERRTARGGRDSIDHPRGAHDDLANAAAGVIVHVLPTVEKRKPPFLWDCR